MPISQSGALEVVNLSDVGRKRPHNEDSTATDPEWGVMLVADGMGGYKAGEVASALAITVILRTVYLGLERRLRNHAADLPPRTELLREAVLEANRAVHQVSSEIEECKGMGTTLVAALFHNNQVHIAHVGDSRLYRLRDTHFQQITKDHSLCQEMIDQGLYSPEEAQEHANKSLVTRALGIREDVEVDVRLENSLKDDIYLLCSDGLNDMLSDRDIHRALRQHDANLEQAGMELVNLANQRGGRDNISVVLVRMLSVGVDPDSVTRPSQLQGSEGGAAPAAGLRERL